MNQPSPAADTLRQRIRERGPITFAEFMSTALYHPRGGYYVAVARAAIGAGGDFYTAPHMHPVFGALLARQLADCWEHLGRPSPFWAVEPGVGTGRLAADVLGAAPYLDRSFAQSLRYVGIDHRPPSDSDAFDARWLRANGLPLRRVHGVILANELLDAMPVHRVTVAGGRLRELRVTLNAAGDFVEEAGDPSTPALAERFDDLGIALPEGHRAEVNLGLDAWFRQAADALDRGWLLLIDYGHDAPAYYDESRSRGTLRCYHRHTINANPYAHVGRQDIGAHVEFTSVRRAAEHAGLRLAGETTQAVFLRNLGLETYWRAIAGRADLPPAIVRGNAQAVEALADEQGMGGFRVLAFAKDAPDSGLAGFSSTPRTRLVAYAPLAGPRHMPLPGASPPPPDLPTWDELLG
ncbi:MAG: SAM-dependent methyltransferase [SAR202 cluster bacterium]|nr:SAM-dependent methyltransferase [SAR202 cluster bacterium]